MRIDQVRTFEDLELYLRSFRNFGDQQGEYDFVGSFQLYRAILENLAKNHLDDDIDSLKESRPCFTESEWNFLKKLNRLSEHA